MKKIQENTIWKTWKKKIPKKYSPYVMESGWVNVLQFEYFANEVCEPRKPKQ